jgi:hypothetical protein
MIISTPHFIVNVIATAEVAEHLVTNVRNFKFVSYAVQELKGGKPDEEEKDMVKIQMLCPRTEYLNVISYLKEHYVERYGVVCYFEEVSVPV